MLRALIHFLQERRDRFDARMYDLHAEFGFDWYHTPFEHDLPNSDGMFSIEWSVNGFVRYQILSPFPPSHITYEGRLQ